MVTNPENTWLLRALFNRTRDLIVAVDHDMRILAFNDAFSEEILHMQGVDVERGLFYPEVISRNDEEREEARNRWARALAGEEFGVTRSYRSPQGEERIYELQFHSLYDEDDRHRGAVMQAHDVTKRVRAQKRAELLNEQLERLVEERTARHEALVNQMTEGLVVFDPQGNLLRMNPAALAIHGFDSDEQLQGHLDELETVFELYDLDGNLLPTEQWPIGRVLAGETFDSYEVRVQRRDTGRRWVGSYGGTMVRDSQGEAILAIVTLRDISDRHEVEEALRDSERRFRDLANAMPQLVWTAKPDGAIDYYNERRQLYDGLELDLQREWRWKPVLHPDDRSATVETWQEAVRAGQVYTTEHRLRMKDGSYRWHLTRAEPAHDSDGRVVKWFGTTTNVEPLKRAEAKLVEADRRKDEFLALLGHELRNPLAAIANGLRVIERGFDGDSDSFAMVQRHVTQMTRLLDDLLDISRITRGRLEVDRRVQYLSPILETAVAAVRPRLEEFEHTLTLEPLETVAVDVDETRVEQILTNLLDNAITYTPPGGHIDVWVDEHDDLVCIHVCDNGRGIEFDKLESIFEPFAQADTGHGRGLGIGLALVRQLVELHDGAIYAHSHGPDEGSEFVVELPRSEQLPEEHPAPASEQEEEYLDDLRILTIDDNADAAEFMGILLSDFGAEVDVAFTGGEGIKLAEEHDYDVVLLDIGLPDVDGRELAPRLRDLPGYEDVCLIAVSGYSQQSDVVASEEAGFDAHLGKPVSPESLRRAILDIIGSKPAPQRAASAASPTPHAVSESAAPEAPQPSPLLPVPEAPVASRSIRALLGQLDHDLKTPLSSLQLAAYLLQRGGQSDEQVRNIGFRLEDTAGQLAELIREALDLGVLESEGADALEREPANLQGILAGIKNHLRAEQDSDVELHVQDGTFEGAWDVTRLRRLLSRLAAGAGDTAGDAPVAIDLSSTDGHVSVDISMARLLPGLDEVRESVKNFNDLHMALRYADHLTRAHGGRLDLRNVDGHGVVHLELPR